MDKLELKTVYVPVAKDSIYALYKGFTGQSYLEELPNVYPLTGPQIVMLLAEYKEGPLGLTEFCEHKGIKM